jgi:light-regulated signal transduction histidine kinase (bacteriophytochrome)
MRNSTIHPDNFLSNLHRDDRDNLLKAAKMTGVRIYFEERACNVYGMPLKDTIGVFTSDLAQDHSEMWNQFNKLMKRNRHPMFRRS